jgi:hypothetical protein
MAVLVEISIPIDTSGLGTASLFSLSYAMCLVG